MICVAVTGVTGISESSGMCVGGEGGVATALAKMEPLGKILYPPLHDESSGKRSRSRARPQALVTSYEGVVNLPVFYDSLLPTIHKHCTCMC